MDSLLRLPVGAGYTARAGRVTTTLRRTSSGVAVETTADSVGATLTLSAAGTESSSSHEAESSASETSRSAPASPLSPWWVAAAGVAILALTIISTITHKKNE